jgi:hypothetical protein
MKTTILYLIHSVQKFRFFRSKVLYIAGIFFLLCMVFLLSDTHLNLTDHSVLKHEAPFRQARVFENYGKLPLYFEPNNGQTDHQVRFLSKGKSYTLFLTPDEAVLSFSRNNRSKATNLFRKKITGNKDLPSGQPANCVLRMKYLGSQLPAAITGIDRQQTRSNYFTGNDPENWQTDIPNYAKVKYENLYDGIDLVFYGNKQKLEYDFIVAPGADPEAIKLRFDGPTEISRQENGDLNIWFEKDRLTFQAPVIYQETANGRKFVQGQFKPISEGEVGFDVDDYNPELPLIIDPVLVYSTFIDHGFARSICVDTKGCAYITGATQHNLFPVTEDAFQNEQKTNTNPWTGDFEAFVTKINEDGTALVYSTYLGGGGGDDEGFSIEVDSYGNAHVTGITYSDDFPVTDGAFLTEFNKGGEEYSEYWLNMDGFVTKLNATGSALIYSSYLGGDFEDYVAGIDIDKDGYAYVAGYTRSGNFPTTPGTYQPHVAWGGQHENAFVTKINPDGSNLVYSTYVGHEDTTLSWPDEYATDIAVDTSGCAYITGEGFLSYSQPSLFVAKLNPNGSGLLYSTHIGNDYFDYANSYAIAVDLKGNAYITGSVTGFDYPTVNGFQPVLGDPPDRTTRWGDAFMTKLNPEGSTILYSTFIGGKDNDEGHDIAVDDAENVYIAGYTVSDDFPTKDAIQPNFAYHEYWGDAFVVKLDTKKSGPASLIYSTYLGGSKREGLGSIFYDYGLGFYPESELDRLFGIVVDSEGNAYVTGATDSEDFPVTENVYDTTIGFNAAFITKIGRILRREHLIYDLAVRSGPPVFSQTSAIPQQVLPQFLLNNQDDQIIFQFEGKRTDGRVVVRVFNTTMVDNQPFPLDFTNSVTLEDPDGEPVLGATLLLIGTGNFGKQFDVTKDGIYTIKVAADSSSTFPAPFQIHLAGNVGSPSPRDFPRATRQDILFNHTAPRPQGIFGRNQGLAQTALFKFANPVEISPFAVAVMVPRSNNGFPLNTAILRAPDPLQPLHNTTPTARTPFAYSFNTTDFAIDFTQVPDPGVTPTSLQQSVCAVIGKNDDNSYTTSSGLIVDMGSGQEIVDGEEEDFQVFSSDGNYRVAVSNTPFEGTFISTGEVVSGTQTFDLANTGLNSARFVLITATDSVTLDAVKALNVFADALLATPIIDREILTVDHGTATMIMRRGKAPQLEFDPFLELIAPDGSTFGEDESGFADKTSKTLTDAALLNIDLTKSGFYRFLGRGYHQYPGGQSSGTFFVRLESGGNYDPKDIVVSEKDELNTRAQKTGTINQLRQRDSYLFQGKPGQELNIVVNAGDKKLDPVLELYDPEGFLIAANDNFEGRDKNPVLQVVLPSVSFNSNQAIPDPSTYRIVVSAVDSVGSVLSREDISAFKRIVSVGDYKLKVFTGELASADEVSQSDENEIAGSGNNDFKLFQTYPNPFVSETKIKYQLPESDNVVLKICDVSGREVEVLINRHQPAGEHEITWIPKGVPGGIYICSLQSGDCFQEKKLIFLGR